MKALSLSQSLYQINKDEVRVNKFSDIVIIRYVDSNGELVNKRFRNKVEYKSGGYLALDSNDLAKSRVFSKQQIVDAGYIL